MACTPLNCCSFLLPLATYFTVIFFRQILITIPSHPITYNHIPLHPITCHYTSSHTITSHHIPSPSHPITITSHHHHFPSHTITSHHHHIPSPSPSHPITSHHIPSHPIIITITSHHIPSHTITSYHIPSHPITITSPSHHITSHHIPSPSHHHHITITSHPITYYHITSHPITSNNTYRTPLYFLPFQQTIKSNLTHTPLSAATTASGNFARHVYFVAFRTPRLQDVISTFRFTLLHTLISSQTPIIINPPFMLNSVILCAIFFIRFFCRLNFVLFDF